MSSDYIKPIWERFSEEDVNQYWNETNGLKWSLIINSSLYLFISLTIYVSLVIFDKCVKVATYKHPSIKFDTKGFSITELRIFNTKNVQEGCKLDSIIRNDNGNLRTPLFEGSNPKIPVYLDPIVKPLLEAGPASNELVVLRWDTFMDYPVQTITNTEDNQENVYNTMTSEKDKQNSEEKSAKKDMIAKESKEPLLSSTTQSKEPFGNETVAESKHAETNEVVGFKSKESPFPVIPPSKEKTGSKETKLNKTEQSKEENK